MGVRADHRRDLTVHEAAHRNLFARRLAVEVEEDDLRRVVRRLEPRDFGFDGEEGVFQGRIHEGPALRIEDGDPRLRCIEDDAPLARCIGRVVHRSEEPWLGFEERDDFLLIPDVVAGRDDGRTGAEKGDGDLRRDAATAGGVLAVDDDEVDVPLGPDTF